jgi:hypothetical protein
MIHGQRGGVIGAIMTMGVIVGADIPMFLGAMVAGPALSNFFNIHAASGPATIAPRNIGISAPTMTPIVNGSLYCVGINYSTLYSDRVVPERGFCTTG